MDNKEQVFNTMRSNLFRSYIFYVPRQFYHYIDPTFISDIIKPDMVNIVFFSNLQQEIHNNPTALDGLELLKKNDLLEANFNGLLKLKNELTPIEFEHIYKRYGEYVGIHCVFTLWMSKNIGIDLPKTSSAIQSMFALQEQTFDKHTDKLENYFNKEDETDTENFEDNQCIEVVSDTIENIPSIEIKTTVQNEPETPKKVKTSKKEKKEPLMTDEKARNYILETVFGIDQEYLF